jgi:hypothetical protein
MRSRKAARRDALADWVQLATQVFAFGAALLTLFKP